jgi:hypothetical protein
MTFPTAPAAVPGPGRSYEGAPRRRRLLFWGPVLLCAAAAAMLLLRHPALPTAGALREHVSLIELPPAAARQVLQILMIPLGSAIVVFVRLTLGLQMLGPFRPILIAIALHITGLSVGALMVVLAMVTVLMVRPRLRGRGVPYFGRLSVLLVCVALVVIATVIAAEALGFEALERVVFFPIVVLMLTADGFARVLGRDGVTQAVWRGSVTLAVALTINLVLDLPGLPSTLLRYPELALVELAAILLIASRLKLRLLRSLNPAVPATGPDEEDLPEEAERTASEGAS